jgi:hypothetical protein
MEVLVQDQRWQFADTALGVEELFDKLAILLNEQQLHINQMTIDGVEIYEDFKVYIEQRLPNVEQIEVNLVTIKQFIIELMTSSHAYCEQAVKQLPELSAQYYQTPSKESWEQFQSFLEGVSWLNKLIELFEGIEFDSGRVPEFSVIGQALNEMLPELLQAMENQDHTAIGDLLQYEALPQLEKLEQELSHFLNEEGA